MSFLGLDQATMNNVAKHSDDFMRCVEKGLAKAYETIAATPETAAFFRDKSHMVSAQNSQRTHWRRLSSGHLGEDYVEQVMAVGRTHARIGLEPRWYIGTYALIFGTVIEDLVPQLAAKGLFRKGNAEHAGQVIADLFRLAMMDMDYGISTYFEAMEIERSKKIEAERVVATDLAESITEVSATIEQISSNIKNTSDNAHQTRVAADGVTVNAEASGEAVETAKKAMEDIAAQIKVVQEIARQTDLLALNAAVEAARAGAQGAGFAVVAAEVRKLAERSAAASREIDTVVTGSLKAAQTAADCLAELLPNVRRTHGLMAQIADAASEQAVGVDEINRAVLRINSVAQSLGEGDGEPHHRRRVTKLRVAS